MFIRCVGSSRYVYNWGLAEWKRQYEAGEKPSEYSLSKLFNSQKDEICPWIREMPYAITGSAFTNLGLAFKNFFRHIKNGDAKAKELVYVRLPKSLKEKVRAYWKANGVQ